MTNRQLAEKACIDGANACQGQGNCFCNRVVDEVEKLLDDRDTQGRAEVEKAGIVAYDNFVTQINNAWNDGALKVLEAVKAKVDIAWGCPKGHNKCCADEAAEEILEAATVAARSAGSME